MESSIMTDVDRTEKIAENKYRCSHGINYVFVMMNSGRWYCQLWKYDERSERMAMKHVITAINEIEQSEWDSYLTERVDYFCER